MKKTVPFLLFMFTWLLCHAQTNTFDVLDHLMITKIQQDGGRSDPTDIENQRERTQRLFIPGSLAQTYTLDTAELLAKGYKALQKEAWENARDYFIKVLYLDPTSREASTGLGKAWIGMGDIKTAEQWLEQLPYHDTEVLFYLTWLKTRLHQTDAAQAYAQKGVEREPNNHLSHYMLAWTFYAKGNYRLALQATDKAIQLAPEEAILPQLLKAGILAATGQEKALIDCLRTLKLSSDEPTWNTIKKAPLFRAWEYQLENL